MTDSSDPQAVSTYGSFSPAVQKAIALGSKEYALKNYENAVEHYGQASELQASETGGNDDPDLLFLYGKALFQVAQKNSQVLGGAPASDPSFDPKQVLATATAATAESEAKPSATISFSGDAEEEEDDEEDGEPEGEEKDDDFQLAWEVLETAKMLYESQLESKKGKSAVGHGSQEDTAIERKMADVCDLLGEVSIENESFDAAVQDLTRALELKVNLYEPSNPIISEAHYKLSLALEFAQQPSPEENKSLALTHLESAITSVKQHVKLLESEGKTAEAKDAQEMIDELTVKVDEMKNPAQGVGVDVSAMFGSGVGGLNEVLQQKLVETLAGGAANDLTGLVRKKEKSTAEAASVGEKRKMEGDTVVGSPGKKVRVENVEDEG